MPEITGIEADHSGRYVPRSPCGGGQQHVQIKPDGTCWLVDGEQSQLVDVAAGSVAVVKRCGTSCSGKCRADRDHGHAGQQLVEQSGGMEPVEGLAPDEIVVSMVRMLLLSVAMLGSVFVIDAIWPGLLGVTPGFVAGLLVCALVLVLVGCRREVE